MGNLAPPPKEYEFSLEAALKTRTDGTVLYVPVGNKVRFVGESLNPGVSVLMGDSFARKTRRQRLGKDRDVFVCFVVE